MTNRRTYLVVFLLVATELIGFGLIIPVLPQISKLYTVSGVWLGVLLSSYSLAQFVAAPFLGRLSDIMGRKPVLVISKLGTMASYLLLAYADRYGLILLSRLLDGLTGGNIAVSRAYLSDITPPEKRSQAMAIIGVAFGTGFILGPALGGLCYAIRDDFFLAGWVGAACSLVSLIMTMGWLRESKQRTHSVRDPISWRQISSTSWFFLITSFIAMVLFSGFESSFSVYTNVKFGLTPEQNSYLFLAIGVVAFVVQGSLMRLAIRPIQRAIWVGFSCIAVALGFSAMGHTMGGSLLPLVFLIVGIAILNTHIPGALSNQSANKGFIMGIYESVNSMARIVGPLLVFICWDYVEHMLYGYMGLFSALMAVASVIGWRIIVARSSSSTT